MNESLKGFTKLGEKVSIYIPSEYKKEIQEVVSMFNSKYGGSTILQGVGTWNGSKGTEIENITIIYSNVTEITDDTVTFILEVAKSIKWVCNQEAVSIELNNELYLI